MDYETIGIKILEKYIDEKEDLSIFYEDESTLTIVKNGSKTEWKGWSDICSTLNTPGVTSLVNIDQLAVQKISSDIDDPSSRDLLIFFTGYTYDLIDPKSTRVDFARTFIVSSKNGGGRSFWFIRSDILRIF